MVETPTLTNEKMQRMIIIQHHKHELQWSDLLDLYLCERNLNISLEGEE